MRGVTRTSTTTNKPVSYTYYLCPHDPGHKAHVAAYPDHPNVMISEKTLMAATASFFAQYVFGPDRAAMLKTQLPADTAQETIRRAAQAKRLDKQLAKVEIAQQALITELDIPLTPATRRPWPCVSGSAPGTANSTLSRRPWKPSGTSSTPPTTEASDPVLLDALPILGDILTQAPPGLAERLFEDFHLQAVYSNPTTRSPSTPPSPTPPPTPSPGSWATTASPPPDQPEHDPAEHQPSHCPIPEWGKRIPS